MKPCRSSPLFSGRMIASVKGRTCHQMRFASRLKSAFARHTFRLETSTMSRWRVPPWGHRCPQSWPTYIWREAFESRALESAILKPKLWLRYVDDIFAIWGYGEEPLNTLHDHLNSQHPAIQFTVEQEVDGRIPFLDVLVERKDTSVRTSVFRKKTHTDQYINFNSHHHPRILTGVIKCLKDRANRICHKSKKKQELKHLEKVFRANDFPASAVMKSLHHVHHHTPQTATDDSKKVLYLPYVRDISERIQQVCRPLGISTVFKSSSTLRQSLVRVKNRIPPEKRKGVVYEIPCQDCEHVYIGETGRILQKRVTEHRSAVRRFDKNNGIAVHAWNEEHAVDWEAARVISTAPHYWNRRTIEAIHIQQTENLDPLQGPTHTLTPSSIHTQNRPKNYGWIYHLLSSLAGYSPKLTATLKNRGLATLGFQKKFHARQLKQTKANASFQKVNLPPAKLGMLFHVHLSVTEFWPHIYSLSPAQSSYQTSQIRPNTKMGGACNAERSTL